MKKEMFRRRTRLIRIRAEEKILLSDLTRIARLNLQSCLSLATTSISLLKSPFDDLRRSEEIIADVVADVKKYAS